jgi:hypothetical protein
MTKHLFLRTTLPLMLLALVGTGQVAQMTNTKTDRYQSGQQTPRSVTTQQLFGRALGAARAPGGFIWMMKCSGEEPVFPDDGIILPLHEALESLTKMDPRYKWQIASGVVNLLPARGEPPLLKIRIRQFKVNTDLSRALDQLLALGEVRAGAARLGLKQNTMTLLVGPSPIAGKSSSIEVNVQNVSLREALNDLVRAHGRAMWQYREYRCNGDNEFSVEFLAR